MSKLYQLIGGFVVIAFAIGFVAYMYSQVTPKADEIVQSTITSPPTEFLSDSVISKLKQLNTPGGIPVNPQSNELSRDNPFLNY